MEKIKKIHQKIMHQNYVQNVKIITLNLRFMKSN